MASGSLSRNREFMLLWSGQTLSSLGSQISQVAYPLLVLAVTGSPAKAGVVGFAHELPIGVLALPGGALADRVDRKRLLIAVDAVTALALFAIPIGLLVGHVPYGVILAVALIDGAGFSLTYAAERGVVPHLVAPEQLGEAVARNESRIFGAMVGGPPLGGLLFALGRAVPFLADAISYAASSITKLLIATDFQGEREPGGAWAPLDGLRWLWERPFFRMVSLLFALGNPVLHGLLLLVVLLAKHHGASSALVGVMLGIGAAGGLIGAMVAPRLSRRLTARMALVGENLVLVLAIPLLLVAHNPLLTGLILAAAMLVTPLTNTIVVGYRVALVPDHLQGRVQAASIVITFSVAWLGPLVVGVLFQHAGPAATILSMTGWALGMLAVAMGSRAFRHPPVLPATRSG
jgi:MFS family permease